MKYFAAKSLAGLAVALAVSASEYFPFKYPTPCITECSVKAGQELMAHYTQDSSSPYFMESLGLLCDSENPDQVSFMVKSAECIFDQCDGIADISKLMALEGQICQWYAQHKEN
ncbi:hypothetical protein K493DRAFT_305332 [Basidiobolus meristosporus CBS 931.73]|uniref:Uncharacterized protein n=1 Tax=Basidiobolus meristosporus CBS 931.73 TaxID=1314790 RepID=A0A1Y1XWA1_9FUNG|nr:hypothetical protein K493DRAFT_305332 [Basidiobolus meristosporus CBS 931.73]|eukprot:ORX89955.1 hypothetical protein K493DRAFT_305332 [Basidiobolus meristosporus CBS 931.73]